MKRVKGQYGVLLTPFKEDGSIDYEIFIEMVDCTLHSELAGLVVSGTSSEFPLYTADDSIHMLSIIQKRNNGRKQIIFCACAPSAMQTISLVQKAEALGINEFLICPPYYMPISNAADIEAYYLDVLASCRATTGIVLYNIPSCTHPITMPLFESLYKHKQIIGIKDSTGNFKNYVNYLRITKDREDFSVLTGADEVLQYALQAGCHGSMTVLGSVFPEAGAYIYKNYKTNSAASNEVQKVVCELVAEAESMSFPDGYKILLELIGLPCGKHLQPTHFTPTMKTELAKELQNKINILKERLNENH